MAAFRHSLQVESMTEPSVLALRERSKRYRVYAREARLKATRYPGELQTAFIRIAAYWDQLALEAEADAASDHDDGMSRESRKAH